MTRNTVMRSMNPLCVNWNETSTCPKYLYTSIIYNLRDKILMPHAQLGCTATSLVHFCWNVGGAISCGSDVNGDSES